MVRLDPPRKRERARWHFQRFVEQFPVAGKMVILDGSWYHYPATEHALGLTSAAEFEEFLHACAEFERTLVLSGITLVKFWFGAEDEEQDRRFRAHIAALAKKRQAPVPSLPKDAQPVNVATVRQAVLSLTNAEPAPWRVILADDRRRARLQCMAELLTLVPGIRRESYRNEQPAPAGRPGRVRYLSGQVVFENATPTVFDGRFIELVSSFQTRPRLEPILERELRRPVLMPARLADGRQDRLNTDALGPFLELLGQQRGEEGP